MSPWGCAFRRLAPLPGGREDPGLSIGCWPLAGEGVYIRRMNRGIREEYLRRALAALSSIALCGCAAMASSHDDPPRHRLEKPQESAAGARGGERRPSLPSGRQSERDPRAQRDPTRETARPTDDACAVYGRFHRIIAGETLWRIAKRCGAPLEELARCNGISDPRRIFAGETVRIPSAPSPAPAASTARPAIPSAPERADEEEGGPLPTEMALAERTGRTGRVASARSNVPSEPFGWPLSGELMSPFGLRAGRMHSGLDLKATPGAKIKASRSGRVLYSGSGFRGYGNVVILDHGDGFLTIYAHNLKNLVHEDERVEAGATIALVGQTGNATSPHLHFEIRSGDRPVDPLRFLGGNVASLEREADSSPVGAQPSR